MYTDKPLAPKPVKKNSNIFGLKLSQDLKNRNRLANLISTPHTQKSSLSFLNSNSLISNQNEFSVESSKREEKDFQIFKNELDSAMSNESAKFEIMSILNKNSSTFCGSLDGNAEYSKNEIISFCEEEMFTITVPPKRTSNPLYKNLFGNSSTYEDEADMTQFRFNSSIFFQ